MPLIERFRGRVTLQTGSLHRKMHRANRRLETMAMAPMLEELNAKPVQQQCHGNRRMVSHRIAQRQGPMAVSSETKRSGTRRQRC